MTELVFTTQGESRGHCGTQKMLMRSLTVHHNTKIISKISNMVRQKSDCVLTVCL